MEERRRLPRMRTCKQAIEEIKAADPNTALTLNRIQVLVRSGKLPHVKAGHKYLINLDMLFDLLATGEIYTLDQPVIEYDPPEPAPAPAWTGSGMVSGIRRVY